MAKSKVTSKDTPRQEPIKHFEVGVVSYLLFDEFYHDVYSFIRRLKFQVGAGFMYEKEIPTALDMIEGLVSDAETKLNEILEKGKAEKGVKKKAKDIFGNDRFWEYVAQLKIDKHDPADILEAWLKEHNPDYFEETAT
jgi:hypothetical protein